MHSDSHRSTPHQRLEALKRKHAALDTMLKDARTRPAVSDFMIQDLKVKKLQVKDEIEEIRRAS
ncbi:MAG: YdcH family protein [Pseudomonadota bacterium]